MARVLIDGGAGLYQGVDIGHRHADPGGVTRQGFRHRQLIQIARVVVVDRRPPERGQITNGLACVVGVTGRRGQCLKLGNCRGRKVWEQAALEHGPFGNVAEAHALWLWGVCLHGNLHPT